MSSAGNETPMQLYIMRMLGNANSVHRTTREVYEPLLQVGGTTHWENNFALEVEIYLSPSKINT